jgi:protein O-GlcNAc transferase
MTEKRFSGALVLWKSVLEQQPDNISGLVGSGDCLMALKEYQAALDVYARAHELEPELLPVLFALGTAEVADGRIGQARDHLRQYLEQDDTNPHAHNNLALALARLGDKAGAERHSARAMELDPDLAGTNAGPKIIRQPIPDRQKQFDMGVACVHAGKFAEAQDMFQSVLLAEPQNHRAWEWLGVSELGLGQADKALKAIDEALRIEPRSIGALHHRAISLRALGRQKDAVQACGELLAVDPGNGYAYSVRGAVLLEAGHIPNAIPDLEAAIASENIGDNKPALQAALAFAYKAMCRWGPELKDTSEAVDSVLKSISGKSALMVISPFQVLPLGLDGEALAEVARRASQKAAKSVGVMPDYKKQMRPDLRIRIGYISPDFVNHSVAVAIREVISCHDRTQFSVEGFSLARAHDEISMKFVEDFDQMHDISGMAHARAAAFIAWRNIDILIELAGHTRGCKPEILAYRPAPVQISAVGYGAPVNASFIPWHLVDKHLVPVEARQYYEEVLIDLPDNALPASPPLSVDREAGRAQTGLPEKGVLLANLGGTYKIDPESFGAWMLIMKGVPDACLVLLDHTSQVNDRLRSEAEQRGISANRLVFVPFAARDLHLARYRHVDLCLDTLNHNGGVTTTDALWLGSPVLTMAKNHLPDRMGSSILNAAGLPELVARDEEHFVALGTRLATNDKALASLRQKVLANHASAPLFDMALYTKNLEAALLDLWTKAVDNPFGK